MFFQGVQLLRFGRAGGTYAQVRLEQDALAVAEQSVRSEAQIPFGFSMRNPNHLWSSFNNVRNFSRAWFSREWTVPGGISSMAAMSVTGRS